jgi:glutamine synthetase
MARHWPTAIERFEASTLIPELMGLQLHQAFSEVKRAEMAEFDAIASRLEYDTYLVVA